VAPFALPGPHTPLSEPKSPGPAAEAEALALAVEALEEAGPVGVLDPDRPQAANASVSEAASATGNASLRETLANMSGCCGIRGPIILCWL
jgi:hypothetical protein